MPAKSVFLSHSSKDDAIVRELRNALEAVGDLAGVYWEMER